MIIIETPIFTRRVTEVLSDEEYRELQNTLVENPELGSVIPRTKGLRKLRFGASGRGKRGGGRLIYYWLSDDEVLYMIYFYRKNEIADLSKEQLKLLAKQVEKFIHER